MGFGSGRRSTTPEERSTTCGRGYTAFAVRPGGGKGTQIREFDAEAESLIMVPQIAGG
jgi:hypothetical protein